jgi:hypothetical protein
MKKNSILPFFLMLAATGCEDQLDVPNPNNPTPESAKTEQGIIALAQGGIYVNNAGAVVGWLGDLHERMGDVVGSPAVPFEVYTPDRIVLDNNDVRLSMNPNGQKAYLRSTNIPGGGNVFYDEWAQMYQLNGTMNVVLEYADQVDMSDAKRGTVKAWAWFWKGFAYSRIGSMYYAGISVDKFNAINSTYLSREAMLAEAEVNFSLAENMLAKISGSDDFSKTIGKLIPSICKVDKGNPLSGDEWIRNINTLRARNLLVSKSAGQMTGSDWDKVLAYASNGIRASDNTFTVRTDALAGIVGTHGYVAAEAVGPASEGGGWNKISERLVQDFKTGDQRFTNNFEGIPVWIGPGDRGTSFNTRYMIVDAGKGMSGVVVYANTETGSQELYLAGTYEENELMLAEAYIYKGNIDQGLARIDEVRAYQGSGLSGVSGTGLSLDQAKEELRRERRVGLLFRGLSFYDARRWGVLENGRTGCVVVDFDGSVHTTAKIEYGFLDYWDVPIAETFYNPPGEGSAAVINPKGQ